MVKKTIGDTKAGDIGNYGSLHRLKVESTYCRLQSLYCPMPAPLKGLLGQCAAGVEHREYKKRRKLSVGKGDKIQ